jgi:hypothetical protein
VEEHQPRVAAAQCSVHISEISSKGVSVQAPKHTDKQSILVLACCMMLYRHASTSPTSKTVRPCVMSVYRTHWTVYQSSLQFTELVILYYPRSNHPQVTTLVHHSPPRCTALHHPQVATQVQMHLLCGYIKQRCLIQSGGPRPARAVKWFGLHGMGSTRVACMLCTTVNSARKRGAMAVGAVQ